ncbi:phosphoesterase [Sphingobium aquiterrae]|uniref:phosphoesterase n=1 Tax=Sphingobium aquiterrae TaxID=2038656 RepID=UPI00301B0B35
MKPLWYSLFVAGLLASGAACAHDMAGGLIEGVSSSADPSASAAGRHWLAGDHHVHSQFSVSYQPDPNDPAAPPKPVLAQDGRYPIPKNAEMARKFGLRWMVSTDHGGPLHSKVDYEMAYPELEASRKAVPEVLQFYGMEFDTPAGDHSSLIIPRTSAEREQLRDIESRFSKREAWPADPARNTEPKMIEALRFMRAQATPPVVFANHPARSAKDVGVYGEYAPSEFRNWNDTAPNVAVGMEGAPGHQAGSLNADGTIDPKGVRGGYKNAPTWGGFDQMTARLGGLWDSMLGEGRHWWITATSDSHNNWRDGGSDFWPGEYSKTYVFARADQTDILDGLRSGRVFVTTGDLISALDVSAVATGPRMRRAEIGGTLPLRSGDDVEIRIRLRDPAGANAGGRTPEVARVDLIVGDVTGPVADRSADRNPTAHVEHRFTPAQWQRDGEYLTMTYVLKGVARPQYVRVRGTGTQELEPSQDPKGENPWDDLWFYSNPIFLTPQS